ncbi:MAG: PilT/PilU family type 4a pilus ATPase [Candidatus Omnitrophica bacterium]|nr:PilT/PilU family type 4a pilus ATPase [Candidatus Omnitrophota bacterium]MBU1367161.1 PilT/PilU family type 4a pilus ATPase [Candidatus Omnitrophota bacterium]MBU1523902.1 PilT/PilU family type 4a pilus ATPase [Candidatus Omnitrophota bacterium]
MENNTSQKKDKIERRKARRFRFRFSIQYEEITPEGDFSVPVTTTVCDVSKGGISFYCPKILELNSKVRITIFLSQNDEVSLIGRVVRMQVDEQAPLKYIAGVAEEDISKEDKVKIEQFLNRTNIYDVLDGVDLKNAIDLHFCCGHPLVIKRIEKYDIDKGAVFDEITLKNLMFSLLDEDRYKKFITEKELNFVFSYREGIRFRINLHMQRGKVEGTFRLIAHQRKLPHELGLPPVIEKLLENKKGLIIVAGSTGSGKTTTLASMVEFLNSKREGIVISIENPIEYLHTDDKCIIKQREIGRDTLSFSAAAKNALRQNPDILVIGEILDAETMAVALTAAESGMLVLTSLHAANSIQALDRVASFFPPDTQKYILARLAFVVRGVMTQELIPRIDGEGFAVAAEMLVMNDPMKNIVRQGDWRQIPTIIQTGKGAGMQSMQDSLEQLYRRGLIDIVYLKGYL